MLLGLVATGAAAVEPCTPFEDGRVDAELLATMREAAREGRMYRVDAETSRVGFCVRHFPFQEFRGEFRNLVGGLALPPDPGQYGHALLLIHSASLISENSDLVPLVIGHSFIDAERYPEILFVGRRFVWLNDRQARIYGELTLRGRTQPVVFNVESNALLTRPPTSTGVSGCFDGLSLAWATAHYIGERLRAFTLFATHYFELTALSDELDATVNVHLDATEHAGKLVFMHAVKDGPANQSYGLQVAALAGVPATVITDARAYLEKLEYQSRMTAGVLADSAVSTSMGSDGNPSTTLQKPLFELQPPAAGPDKLRRELDAIDPDNLTPKQALEILYRLKKKT